MIERGDWKVSNIARNAFDLENKVVGTIGAGRIGYRVLQRLVPFDCKELLYFDYAELPESKSSNHSVRCWLLIGMYRGIEGRERSSSHGSKRFCLASMSWSAPRINLIN